MVLKIFFETTVKIGSHKYQDLNFKLASISCNAIDVNLVFIGSLHCKKARLCMKPQCIIYVITGLTLKANWSYQPHHYFVSQCFCELLCTVR